MSSRMHEREPDLRAIIDALDQVVAGRGQVAVVEGPAGIGKTILLQLAGDAARERSLAVASARGSDLEWAHAQSAGRRRRVQVDNSQKGGSSRQDPCS